ncbi:MAG: aminoacyl-tRNA deacylase [Solirubrobacteraceae bacterium]
MAVSDKHQGGAVTTTYVGAIVGFLRGAGVSFELVEHEPVTSAPVEARTAGQSPERTAKTIVLHDGSAYAIVAVTAADRLDLHKLRELLGASRQLRLATEQEIARDFPFLEVGAVPPFGPMVPSAEVIDSTLARQPRILCPAGDHRHSVLLDPRDVVRITAATVADIREE